MATSSIAAMSKVALIAKLPVKAGRRDELVAAFQPMLDAVNDEAGTEIYILSLDQGDENVAYVFELYSDADAMGAHSSSDTMAALIGSIGELFDGDAVFTMLAPVGGKGL